MGHRMIPQNASEMRSGIIYILWVAHMQPTAGRINMLEVLGFVMLMKEAEQLGFLIPNHQSRLQSLPGS